MSRPELPRDVQAALEYVAEHLRGAGNYDEAHRGMALRYVQWVLKPKPEGATLTECGRRHKIWRAWKPNQPCPVCVGLEGAMKQRLSPEVLRRILKRAIGKEATWQEIDQVKDHCDALEAEIASLKSEAEGRRHDAMGRMERG